MRILIATHSPLSAEFGAGQMAINLVTALRNQGHDVTLWSPQPMPNLTRWWQQIQVLRSMRSKLDTFLDSQDSFDVIDCSGIPISKKVATSAIVVYRSVQPDILYIVSSLLNIQNKGIEQLLLLPFNCLVALSCIYLIMQGWGRANYILCLGSLELKWMSKWFPWWRGKLFSYVNALSKNEQLELQKVRSERRDLDSEGLNFLWIGRWVAHKGVSKLVKFIIQRAATNQHDTFTIAGCGTNAERDFPPELIKAGKVKIIPSFKRSEVYTLLANCNVGLFTSDVEGWGLTLNEMLESGMPVFGTAAGGYADLQPFFKTLMPFPPPAQFTPEFMSEYQDLDTYYRNCSWDKIAKIYPVFYEYVSSN
jgi:glycosyltransferase involved in cell wall biosynthesis